ncbi:hypothetical protein [Streptomyces sp. RPT161]|uniref:hypothetical protein n=1 Tax=Streptomyces sp. RPT161 TaxID=3015993 RepID=UPI0022B883CF|nr:hypothetical protein [Streptomyces sp. RPT161]
MQQRSQQVEMADLDRSPGRNVRTAARSWWTAAAPAGSRVPCATATRAGDAAVRLTG